MKTDRWPTHNGRQRDGSRVARAVSSWLHRVILRDHGPPDSFMKLALFAVNSFMNERATCHPSQEAVAAAASLGVTTVRRKLAEASRLGWIARFERAKTGQRWKAIEYRACIPDHIDTAKYDHNEDKWRAQFGHEIPAESLRGTLYPQRRSRKAPAAAAGPTVTSAVTSRVSTGRSHTEDRPPTHEAPAADDEKDRPQRPTKFSEEVSQESSQWEGRSPSGSQPASDMHVFAKRMEATPSKEPLDARLSKARILLTKHPEFPSDKLCAMFALTPQQASEARMSAA